MAGELTCYKELARLALADKYTNCRIGTYLASVGIRSTICHAEDSRACMLQSGMNFIIELLPVY